MRSPVVFCLSFALFAGGGVGVPDCSGGGGCGGGGGGGFCATTPSSIRITPANPTIAQGNTQQFTAVVTFRDGHTEDLRDSVAWSSDNTIVATIDSRGLASGVGPGISTIRGVFQDVSATTTLTVSATQAAASITGGARNAIVTLTESARSFAYVADDEADRLLLFAAVGGALEPSGEVRFAPGSRPVGITVHPSGRFLYVVNQGARNVTGFHLDSWSGALTPIGPPVLLAGRPEWLELDANGMFATASILDSWEQEHLRILPETGEILALEH